MTAVRRPEILKRTLSSFFRNCFATVADRCRLIINVDPVGEKIASWELCDIISAYFPHYVIGMPMTASFPHAFKWCWKWAAAPWVFHLEDDWELCAPVEIDAMIQMMEAHPKLASLRLPFFRSTEDSMKNWNIQFPWNGYYFECPEDRRKGAGFAGHPSLLRGDFVQRCAPLIDTNLNPEKQFHGDNGPLVNEVLKWEYGVWGQPNQPKMIEDIGLQWKIDNGFQKAGSKAFFKTWEKVS